MAFARIFQARMLGRLHGQQTVNVLHFGSDETAADNAALVAILVELATKILFCATTQLLGGVTEDWQLVSVEAKQIYPALSDPQTVSAAPDTNGSGGPTNVSFAAVLLNIRSGTGGRRGRGRAFLPPPGDSAMTNSVLSDSTTGGFYNGFITCMSNQYIGSGKTENQQLGILSRKAISEGTTIPNAFKDAVTLEVNQEISCLRSRKVGHGN